jgi:hypothetical protein
VEGKCRRRISELRWEQQVRKDVTQKKVHGQRSEEQLLWEDIGRWTGLVAR